MPVSVARPPTRGLIPFLALPVLLLTLASCGPPTGTPDETATADESEAPPAAPSPFDRARELTAAARHEEAAAEYARLAEQFAREGDSQKRWKATVEQARSLFRTSRRDEAFTVIRKARELADGVVDREALAAYYHAAFLHESGRLDEALEVARYARDRAERSDDAEVVKKAYGVLATVYSLMGRYEQSLAINEWLADHFRRVRPDARGLAEVLNELGIDYRHFGRLEDARRVYEEALAYFRREGPDRWLRIVLYNLSNVDMELGDTERSLDLRFKALDLLEGVDDPYGMGLTLDGIGKAYYQAGNLFEARKYLDRAIEVGRESARPYVLLGGLIGLAEVEVEDGHPGRARDLLVETVTTADESGYGFQGTVARAVMARAEVDLGNPEQALRWAEESLERAGALGDPSVELQAMHARALALEALGRRSEAAEQYDRTISLLESWRGRLSLGDLRMGLAESRTDVFEDAIENLMELDRVADAFAVAERARARLLLELLADRRAPGPEDRRGQIVRRLREKYVAAGDTSTERLRKEFDREIDALIAELESTENRARRQDPLTAASRYPRPITAAAAQKTLASPRRAVLGYFWGERDVYGWWIGADGVRGARLGRAEELGPTIEFLRAAVERPDSPVDWRVAARAAYPTLVAPLAPDDVTDLLIVPDGPLNYLPLGVLIPDSGNEPWAAELRIVYGPSASVLAAHASAPPAPPFERAVLALAAPTLDSAPQDEVYRQGLNLAPLPQAADEARYIADLYRSQGATLLLGAEATAERWIEAEPDRYRYLHFATHAVVSDRRPELTHLVLAGQPLDLETIRHQPTRAELVTVSACESAIGKRVRGEGIVGLPHAFLASGARGAVVALWKVEDRSAADFMRGFYRELHDGNSPAEALRRLRKSWIAEPGRRSHPSRWASFIQVGGVH